MIKMNITDLDKFINKVFECKIENWIRIEDLIFDMSEFEIDFKCRLEGELRKEVGDEITSGPLIDRLRSKINSDSKKLFELISFFNF